MSRGAQGLEQLPSAGEHVVQRVLEMRGGFGEVAPHLIQIFVEALFDFVAEERFERPIAQPFRMFGGVICHDIGNERAR